MPTDQKLILFVAGYLTKRKGLIYLLDAMRLLKQDNLQLALAGQCSEDLSTFDEIYRLGTIADDRLMCLLYAAVDVLIVPSLEDNLPNVAIESLLSGTPVVGFNIGGMPDIVMSGKNGFLCNNQQASDLAKTIQTALAHPFDREWIRKDATQRFAQEVQVDSYQQLFVQLLEEDLPTS